MENQLKGEVRRIAVSEEYHIETRGKLSTLFKNGKKVEGYDGFDRELVYKVIYQIAVEICGSAE